VRAAISFVRRGGRVAVITSPGLVVDSLASDDPADQSLGTRITSVTSRSEALA
jgi:carbamate kinase